MKIPLLDLVAQYQEIKPEIDSAIQRVLDSGWFILGDEVISFEEEVSDYLGTQFSIGVASGTDALILSLRSLNIGPGDEVILPAYTFFATIGAVIHAGASPVLVDIDPMTYCLDTEQVRDAITPKTKAVIPVHLYGHPADMDPLLSLAHKYDLKIIEDNAQAFGAEYDGRKTGSMGDIACLSFFPSKNLGGYGDGGMIVTNSEEISDRIRQLRAHGWKRKYFPEILGYNSRLDALQAAILKVKLKYIDDWNLQRRNIARRYTAELSGIPGLQIPSEKTWAKHVYHLYIIQSNKRDLINKKLDEAGIATGIYYPQPIHLAEPCLEYGYKPGDFPISERSSLETLAIPLYPGLGDDNIYQIITNIKGLLE